FWPGQPPGALRLPEESQLRQSDQLFVGMRRAIVGAPQRQTPRALGAWTSTRTGRRERRADPAAYPQGLHRREAGTPGLIRPPSPSTLVLSDQHGPLIPSQFAARHANRVVMRMD